MKTRMKAAFVLLLLLLAVFLSSLGTYFFFPRTVVESRPETTITWAIGHGYHYSIPVIMEYLELMEKYSGGTIHLDVITLKAPAISEALIAGSLQFGQRSGPAVLKDIDNKAPFKMLVSVGKKNHELWTSNPEIQSIADLTTDNIVNVLCPNSIEEMGLKIGLEELGRPLDSVTTVYLKHDVAYQAMLTGEIDCDYTGAPYTARYAREPDTYHLIGTDTELFGLELPASMVYAKTSFVESNPEIIACTMSAWFEAISWINENTEEASKIVAKFYGDPIETAYQDWLDSGLVLDPTFGISSLPSLSEILADVGITSRTYTAEEILFETALGLGGLEG